MAFNGYYEATTNAAPTGGSVNAWTKQLGWHTASSSAGTVYTKTAAAGDVGATFTCAITGGTGACALGIIDLGPMVNTTTPIDSIGTGDSGTSSSDPTASAITIVNTGAMLLWCSAVNSTSSAPTIPTGFTAAFPAVAPATGTGDTYGIACGYKANQASGTTGSQASGTLANNWVAVMIGIAP